MTMVCLRKVSKPNKMTAKNIYEVFTKDSHILKGHTAELKGVTYKGFQSYADTTIQFRGLPYGSDTSGNNRFKYAELFTTSSKEIDCTKYGPACWQHPVGARMIYEGLGVLLKEGLFPSTKKGSSLIYGDFSEDCLNLNLWTPKLDEEKRPVLVWIHGGAFKSGSNIECELYNGNHLAQRGNVVVICLNYRFGMFGFNFPEENRTNIALSDQILGLKWIQENISQFGGDPNNVTIFGESAGGISVASLLGSPMAKGLFHKAICQSGGAENMTKQEFNHLTIAATKSFKLNTSNTLRPEDLLTIEPDILVKKGSKIEETLEHNGSSKIGFMPIIDGKYICEEGTLNAIQSGKGSKIPLLVGSNAEEMKLFFALLGWLSPFDEKTVLAAIRQRFNLVEINEPKETYEKLKEISEQLKALTEKKLQNSLNVTPKKQQILEALLTFLQFTIPSYELAEAQNNAECDVYSYILNYGSEKYGACHGIDLQLLWNFGHPNEDYFSNGKNKVISENPKAAPLARFAESIQDAWIHFAWYGKPASIEKNEWKAFPNRMDLDLSSSTSNWNNDEMIIYWKSVRSIFK